MIYIKKLIKYLTRFIPDKLYLTILYYRYFHKIINWRTPKTFNEKLQWLKLYDRQSEYSTYVDKYLVKSLIDKIIGKNYYAELLGVWSSTNEIDFDKLPNQFVLKVNHTSGGVIVVKEKSNFDFTKYKNKLDNLLKTNYYYSLREYPYKNVKPKIFAEQLLENPEQKNLVVYKVFCFNGIPKIMQVIQDDKQKNETIDYFDCEWNLLNLKQNYPNSKKHLSKPLILEEMLDKSKLLSKNIPFIRVDWYIVQNRLYFSEFTFYSDAGFEKFYPSEWDKILGSYIRLPIDKDDNVKYKLPMKSYL